MSKKKISIVAGAYNEQDNVRKLYERVKSVMDQFSDKYDYEQLIIDNASTDHTLAELRQIAAQDKNFKVIVNTRNFGHIRSPYHAFLQCQGDAVIALASDLEDPPELIAQFIEKWEQGYPIVLAQKNKSKENPCMVFVRNTYYRLLNKLNDSGAPLLSNCTGFGLFDKKVVDQLRSLNDPYPYLRGLICELGYDIALIPFTKLTRKQGVTKNNLYTLYDNAMLGFTNHSKVPLRLAAITGFVLGVFSFLLAVLYLILKLLYWDSFPLGMAPLLLAVLFFAAVQLFFLGILGEYVGAILTQVLKRPLVIEKERINF